MKILELRFKNLNSLYGEWIIDFSNPEYVSNGIFALTGPTGAGKSTILDAVCLALYGATPRLGKVTQSGNEIMSRHTGECYAEVVFESQAGRFRCHWEQRRARKKTDGALQMQEHQIVDAETNKPIETQIKKTAKVIEEKTGMDFDRFTRSILLAQGGFDTFLKADEEQKSKILEQITGTEIYSEISRRVHERQRQERESLNLLNAHVKDIVILDEEQEKETRLDLETKDKNEKVQAEKFKKTEKAILWLELIDRLKLEIKTLDEEAVKLQSAMDAFKPERKKLLLAKKAASLDSSYATLLSSRKHQAADTESLSQKEKFLPKIQEAAKLQAETLQSLEEKKKKAKENLQHAAPLIQQIRAMDQRLADQKKKITEDENSIAKDEEKIGLDKASLKNEQEKEKSTRKKLDDVSDYFKEHLQDEWLIGGYAGIEEQLNHFISKQKEILQKEARLKKAEEESNRAKYQLELYSKDDIKLKQKLANASTSVQKSQEKLNALLAGSLLREYRAKLESLYREKHLLNRITELKEHRKNLEDGNPCPLCGAEKHPYAEGNIPISHATDKEIESIKKLITEAEEHEANSVSLKEREAEVRNEINRLALQIKEAESNKKSAEKTFKEITQELENHCKTVEDLKQTIAKKLQRLGINVISDGDVSSLLGTLKSRLDAWQEKLKQKENLQKQLYAFESEVSRLNAVIETHTKSLKEKQESLQKSKQEITAEIEKRKTLYGDKNPDEEENRLSAAVTDAEKSVDTARSQNTNLQQKLTSTNATIEQLKNQINRRKSELDKEEACFTSALKTADFSSEKTYLEAKLKPEELEALSNRAKELDNNQTDLNARKNDRTDRLNKELTEKKTDQPLEKLKSHFKQQEDSLKELRESIISFKHRLEENKKAKERLAERENDIKAQEKECYRWEKLHGLIGSLNGKKYRQFAQGLTFDILVNQANFQLKKMTDRYLLMRNENQEQPLELNVIDDYQAGEIRSTKNLSGGESFIVSLSLALGLSKMASKKVRVDSLFLDEGFGTLDEEALEVALETLSGLQQDGKLIGIISHVSALKERIGTQINITSISGGRSSLAGPGCSKVVKSV